MDGRKKTRLAIATAVTLVVAGLIIFKWREQRLYYLFDAAIGYRALQSDSGSREMAAQKLGEYGGTEAAALLLEIARGNRGFSFPRTQIEAIKALRTRHDTAINSSLASLLVPHEVTSIRLEVAQALAEGPCDEICIRLTLHYIERIWWGEKDLDARFSSPPELIDLQRRTEATEHDALRNYLYDVLRRNRALTVSALRDVYGLGSGAPSAFAVVLSREAGIPETCQFLLRSQTYLDQVAPEQFDGPRVELKASLAALGCR
jgi:hypothetical protein